MRLTASLLCLKYEFKLDLGTCGFVGFSFNPSCHQLLSRFTCTASSGVISILLKWCHLCMEMNWSASLSYLSSISPLLSDFITADFLFLNDNLDLQTDSSFFLNVSHASSAHCRVHLYNPYICIHQTVLTSAPLFSTVADCRLGPHALSCERCLAH